MIIVDRLELVLTLTVFSDDRDDDEQGVIIVVLPLYLIFTRVLTDGIVFIKFLPSVLLKPTPFITSTVLIQTLIFGVVHR